MIEAKNDYLIPKLAELVTYDPERGEFRWKQRMSARVYAGDIAGTVSKSPGYRQLKIDGKKVRAARLAVYMMARELPAEVVDHINGIKTDDRYANLRCVTQQQNLVRKAPRTDNTNGFPGVQRCKFKRKPDAWRASIKRNGVKQSLGIYSSPLLAWLAYVAAKQSEHGPLAYCDLPGRIAAMRASADEY